MLLLLTTSGFLEVLEGQLKLSEGINEVLLRLLLLLLQELELALPESSVPIVVGQNIILLLLQLQVLDSPLLDISGHVLLLLRNLVLHLSDLLHELLVLSLQLDFEVLSLLLRLLKLLDSNGSFLLQLSQLLVVGGLNLLQTLLDLLVLSLQLLSLSHLLLKFLVGLFIQLTLHIIQSFLISTNSIVVLSL